jgi:tetratricopeptide (TPR) repeat protein
VLSHAAFLDRARLEREHERDEAARWALAGYVVARLVDRRLAGEHQGEAREALLWQLKAVQGHLRELPPESQETAHLTGIVENLPVDGSPLSGLRVSLTAYAYFLEHEGRLEEGLDILELVARTQAEPIPPAEYAALALFAGRLNRLMARWDLATTCYGLAEAAASSVGNTASALRSRLGRTAVLWGQGNLPLARATVEAVIADAAKACLPEVEAMAHADLGAVLAFEGLRVEAVTANYRAFMLAEDTLLRMRVLGDLGIGLLELGAYETARMAFELVIGSQAGFVIRTNALIELLELESAVGNRVSFERRRAEAADVLDRMPRSMAADFHYKSGIGLARFGQLHRARELLQAGLALAERHALNTWYFRFDRVLANLESCETREPVPANAKELSGSPAIQEVTVGLREYASLPA